MNDERLVNIEAFIPGIRLDIRYATANNLTKRPFYQRLEEIKRKPLWTIELELYEIGGFVAANPSFREHACPFALSWQAWRRGIASRASLKTFPR
jgi:zinc D-Ala-D-Ala dipeptidase